MVLKQKIDSFEKVEKALEELIGSIKNLDSYVGYLKKDIELLKSEVNRS